MKVQQKRKRKREKIGDQAVQEGVGGLNGGTKVEIQENFDNPKLILTQFCS